MKCKSCKKEAAVALRSHNAAFCEDCYLTFFRRQLEKGIHSQRLFSKNEKILVALSGGKDSMSLLLELTELGYSASGLFIDLAIPGSSEKARAIVQNFCQAHGLDLLIVDLAEEGIPIPIVKKVLKRPVCSACGQIKRHFFNKTALEKGFDCLATGHNLDDETSRLFSNILRWDHAYLGSQGPLLPEAPGFARKVKPLWRLSEFETANYAFLRGIEHSWEPCPYSGGATFSFHKGLLGRLERGMPGRKLDFYQGFLERGRPAFANIQKNAAPPAPCPRCGSPTAAVDLCGVCRLRELVAQAAI